ncbi:ABC-type branched-subunit amino acid transport system permease subunit/ABC-type branched-subunit amino acid transport system ATPase component [Nocardioides marinisabuli]|uniref:ABC-type branched-subunit amino acid transport system permease subunit/ABC-type branched-subunit amino acid transport system ATPase component n=1 Tax=Nocardioides marinisabuli TaxID=419476 RepID=A0A7Y9JQG5_9ACTN|nr:branched-chain amino acid ABC transporter ATP-binding protein/permease [Nocardioides marinisabuli]NYD57186.1 ABC-type branched-subunit amino acid transport system permease subunit/ABC-type branched-subunit amino acid transport system ATPase component [Nocardioides marinisabuli]
MTYYLTSLMGLLPIFIILGVSFNLLLGYGGLLSVSHAGFFGIGAYATAILIKDYQLEFLPAVLVGAVLAGVMSLTVGYAAGRLSDEFLFIVTIAVQVALVELFNNLQFTGRSAGIAAIPRPTLFGYQFDTNLKVAILAWVFCAVIVAICWRVVHSPYGRLLKALREDVPAARSLGKRALWTKVTVFAFSSAIAGIAGGLYTTHTLYISPAEFTLDRSVEVLSITIIGGLAAFWGPFVGAVVVLALPEALSFANIPDSVAGPINGIIYTTAVLLLLIYRPRGLLGRDPTLESERNAARRAKDGKDTLSASSQAATSESGGTLPLELFNVGGQAPATKILRSEGLGIAFGGLKAVDDVTVAIHPGKITALVGPNGAGKTTVFNLLSGALKADEGRTFYGDRDISGLSIEQRAQLGVVRSFQEVRLFEGMTVQENIHVAVTTIKNETIVAQFVPAAFRGRDEADERRAERMLLSLGLYDKRHSLARDLSYAEQKMLMMGRLLATGASCYLLDEPMSGLDQGARAQLSDLLQQIVADGSTSICIVEHSMQVVREVASWVMFLDRGRLLTEGTPEDVMNDPELTALYFGRPV